MERLDARTLLSGIQGSFTVVDDWGSGFQAQVRLANEQATPVTTWRLEFDYAAQIGSIWDAKVVSHVGSHYVIAGAGWNNDLAAGGTVSFGFVGSPGKTTAKPTNWLVNGVPIDTGGAVVPALSVSDARVVEGNSGTATATFAVGLSQASAAPVTVRYATSDQTASAGSDYTAASGTLTFAPGETSKTVSVAVLGDIQAESDEAFALTLSSPAGATLSRAQAVGTIVNDDAGPSLGQFSFRVTNDWGTGFNGEITVRNDDALPVKAWTLSFDFPVQISSIWNAKIVSRSGNRYTIQGADWNKDIAAGGSVSFGFTASPGGVTAGPTNYALKSGGGTGGTNQAPTAAKDSAWTYAGEAASIAVLANDSDPDGDTLAIASVTQGAKGKVVANANGTVSYTPNTGYVGADSFTYTVSDGRGGTATAAVDVSVLAPNAAAWPQRVYAPYVDMTLYPTPSLTAATDSAGVKYFTLAFIVADPQKRPSWGGYAEYAVNGGAFDQALRAQVAGVRARGGDVIVSFGGAANQELAQVITDVNALKAAYQTVIDAYRLTRVDFDIEGAAAADRASIDRRSQALAALQASAAQAGKALEISYTLPVLPTGLTPDGLYVLQSALRYGVKIAGANIMAMDYGDSAAPNPNGRMGDYAIQAANSLFGQLKGLYGTTRTDAQLWATVGVTPMIGLNDVITEVFDQQEARELVDFAKQKGIGRLAIWSLNRDRQNPNGAIGYVEPTSSSLVQSPYEFSKIFLGYQA